MKLNFSWALLILFAFIFIQACDNKKNGKQEKPLSTDLIHNSNSAAENKNKAPEISFEKTEHDFGTLVEGVTVKYAFKFTNTGNADLLLSKVKPDCGCTVADYPKTPIAPGEHGKIEFSFNTSNRTGLNIKRITVLTNSEPNTVVLSFKSMIK
jgi:hypothetical protein